MILDEVAGRVLGSLLEKELATPQQYPLTVNSLVLACNQTTNRDPVMTLTEPEVQLALERLKERRLVRFVFPSHGRSAVRYRHVVDEQLGLDEPQRALLAMLLLRGPQTPGELRSRTDRLTRFDRLEDVDVNLEALAARAEPLVKRLARQPGHKEQRWQQLLAAPADSAPAPAPADSAPAPAPADSAPAPAPADSAPAPAPADSALRPALADASSSSAVGTDLRAEVADLRTEVAELRAEVADLR